MPDAPPALPIRAVAALVPPAHGAESFLVYTLYVEDAVAHAERLEILRRQSALAKTQGEPNTLTDEQWNEFFSREKNVADPDFAEVESLMGGDGSGRMQR